MKEYTINVTEIEELQTTKNIDDLDRIFSRAHSTIVQGGSVVLNRENADGSNYTFDELTTENDLKDYKDNVFKYL